MVSSKDALLTEMSSPNLVSTQGELLTEMSDPDVLSTQEALLTQLYLVVSQQEPELATRLTGMFAHWQPAQLLELLRDSALRERQLTEARAALSHARVVDISKQSALEDRLHTRVGTLEKDQQKAAHITGLLMQEDERTLQLMMINDKVMESFVTGARRDFGNYHQQINSTADMEQCGQDVAEADAIADAVFGRVSTVYKHNAPKITGMVLEMEPHSLYKLLADDTSFKATIERCREALEATAQWLLE